MSVFTVLSQAELAAILTKYALTEFTALPVVGGTQNSIYQINAREDSYLLIIYEKTNRQQFSASLSLLEFLAAQHFPTNAVIADQEGAILQTVHDKPAALLRYLPGQHRYTLTEPELILLGRTMGLMHALTQNLSLALTPIRAENWRLATIQKLSAFLTPEQQAYITQALAIVAPIAAVQLPQGIIHADLFLDNVLFDGNQISGFIDFFDATHGVLLYDLAVAALDALIDPATNAWDYTRSEYLFMGYESIRTLTTEEKCAWPAFCVLAALTFWLLRLENFYFPAKGLAVKQKDPLALERVLVAAIVQHQKVSR